MIYIEIIIVFLISSMFWVGPLITHGYMTKFRIKQKYSSHNKEYYYIIEQLWWGFWIKCESNQLRKKFTSCKEAEESLQDWYLEETTDDIIIEREYEL